MSLAYAIEHRTESLQLDDTMTTPPLQIPPTAFLPSKNDWQQVKGRLEIIVQRLLVEHVPALADLKGSVTRHIGHAHTKELSTKSKVVSLGTIDANPASTPGVIEVMEKLHDYIPEVEGKLHKIVVNGDQLSVERYFLRIVRSEGIVISSVYIHHVFTFCTKTCTGVMKV